ncbi:glyoxalase domain protein (homolog to catechol-2,3-dioxygenase) (plasmid) [Natrialba magadii ATCC 43099]|uniref:Glyoxalase domain protein (Homolog to catechol-2,3-dioxygenase) n=1 Tax=Natrialba magadii (strain ATCC 43099 / DSM 3394 / CCM 3739 / CIP 104546 / IAM 13178 / JCM 8861 / NBRC 102185 / NCIMB 2190 / MS3) TaxID=547559 RepID=D3T0Y1_NATMM|nr:VOC family protein [Natrialba magadii]ADD07240.1 glyoxalase domain protein (homolog to catechol-2,3-dioxygenase) [Natrialba magadii ATCC 43099]ELY34351.1 Glyoxalase/bleomycin resistance protein/dioxygenase [Natrialba magadii ATCC 43099]
MTSHLNSNSNSNTNPNSYTLPKTTSLGRIALQGSDLPELASFYQAVVGLTVLDQTADSAVLGVEETPLLVLEQDESASERGRANAGLFHTAFRVPSRAALGDAVERIRTNWQLTGASDHGVSEALYLTDPEGNGIEIYRDFPREEWPRAADGVVQMTTRPLDLGPLEAAAPGADSVPKGTDLGHVHLEVTSLETFADSYVDTLGFTRQTTVPDATFVSAGGYHHHLGANTWNNRTEPHSRSERGLRWFEVLVPDERTLETVSDRVSQRQGTSTSTPTATATLTELDDGIAVTDPDGIEIRFRVAS